MLCKKTLELVQANRHLYRESQKKCGGVCSASFVSESKGGGGSETRAPHQRLLCLKIFRRSSGASPAARYSFRYLLLKPWRLSMSDST